MEFGSWGRGLVREDVGVGWLVWIGVEMFNISSRNHNDDRVVTM